MKLSLCTSAVAFLALAACGGDAPPPDTTGDGATTTAATGPGADGPLGAVPVPADNPLTDAKVALGHQLFFEPRLSVDGSRSCYSCHLNEDGNGGGDRLAVGAGDVQLTRHSPVIWNVGYFTRFYWEGRAASLEAQALAAWGGGNMGVGADNLDAKAAEIGQIPGYAEAFAAAFPDRGATAETVAQSISAYERTLVCDDTRYDRFQAGQTDAMNAQEQRGMGLFMGKGGCVTCHTPPLFTTQAMAAEGIYYNVGIGIEGVPEDQVDVGRQSVSERPEDWAAFKVPSLRNVARSAPYLHNGSVDELEEVVRFMGGGGFPNRNLTPMLIDRALTDTEVADLTAFLGSLSCGDLEQPTLPS